MTDTRKSFYDALREHFVSNKVIIKNPKISIGGVSYDNCVKEVSFEFNNRTIGGYKYIITNTVDTLKASIEMKSIDVETYEMVNNNPAHWRYVKTVKKFVRSAV